jgi:hypothetical protein
VSIPAPSFVRGQISAMHKSSVSARSHTTQTR